MSDPKVFISYSWESDSHKHWVRRLAERLVQAGVDVTLDQWQIVPGESLTAFMEGGVRDADFVIIICTPTLASKADSRAGGVGYEQQIVSGDLLQGTPRSKFIPLLRLGELARALPAYLSGSVVLDFRSDTSFETSFEDLLRALFKKRRFIKPVLGTPPPLLPENDAGAQPVSVAEVYVEKHCLKLDDQLKPVEGPHAFTILIGEVLDSIQRKLQFEVEVTIPRLRDARSDLSLLTARGNLTLEEREQRLKLRQLIRWLSFFDVPADEFLSEVITIVVPQLWHTSGLTGAEEISDCLSNTISLFAGAPQPNGAKFEIFPTNRSWYASFEMERKDAEEFADRRDVPLGYLVSAYGLLLSDFPSEVIRARAIPALIFEYFRLRYVDKDSVPPVEDFFKVSRLRVGLG